MFDNLREQANPSPFYEEEAQFQEAAETTTYAPPPRRPSSGKFLGLNAPQRFFLSLMLMMTVCIIGALALVVTGKFGF